MNYNNTAIDDDGAYSPAEMLGVLIRRKSTIAVFTLAMLLFGAWFSFTTTPTYEVSAKVVFLDRLRQVSPAGKWSDLPDNSPASTEIDILTSRAMIARLIGEVHADGSKTGMGLCQTVQDMGRYWPWPKMKRKIFGGAAPQGSIQVWTDGVLPAAGVEIEFLEKSKVKLSVRSLFGASQTFDSFGAEQPLQFLNRNVSISGDGTEAGRTYVFHSNPFAETLNDVRNRLKVNETLKASGVLELRYIDSDPRRATEVLNQLLAYYIEQDQQRLATPAAESREFLQKEIATIEASMKQADKRLLDFQSNHGDSIVLEDAALVLVQKLAALDMELAQKEYQLQSLKDLDSKVEVDQIRVEEALFAVSNGLFTAPMRFEGDDPDQLDPTAADLKLRLSSLLEQRAELALEHPKDWAGFAQLDARIDFFRGELREIMRTMLLRASGEVSALQDKIERDQKKLNALPQTHRQLAGFQREVTALEETYALLLTRFQTAIISERAAKTAATMEVIDPATEPIKAKFPRPFLITVLAAVLGVAIGIIVAILKDAFAKPLLSCRQLESACGLRSLGTLPRYGSKLATPQAVLNGDGIGAEAIRSLRANLISAKSEHKLNSICFVAGGSGEGVSTTAAALAISLARAGDSVLLVDADLRNPTVATSFGLGSGNGFADTAPKDWQQAAQATSEANLFVLSSGKVTSHPANYAGKLDWELGLAALKSEFDWVLIDAPSLLAVSDSASMLQHVDGAILLSRYDFLSSRVAQMAASKLRNWNVNLIGCVFNGYRPLGFGGYVDGFAFGREAKRISATEK